jgi:hypothetical protein
MLDTVDAHAVFAYKTHTVAYMYRQHTLYFVAVSISQQPTTNNRYPQRAIFGLPEYQFPF